ncbi:MAG TPA: CGNR zinc finger domain-containing protein [Ilumatobacteraceae bacterium]|nr:CGNR zinc finger domain-containing protein [Ilumatobacteraceae bacterium]
MGQHLFIEFVNSELFDGNGNREDRLLDDNWRQAFLRRWDMALVDSLDDSDLRQLMELRTSLRSITERLDAGRAPARRDLECVNAALAGSPVTYRLSGRGVQFDLAAVPLGGNGARAIAATVALSAARFLSEGATERLKTCDNDGCRWVFFDETKNRSRRWCGPCGNVDKVRRFRERQRAARSKA